MQGQFEVFRCSSPVKKPEFVGKIEFWQCKRLENTGQGRNGDLPIQGGYGNEEPL